MYQVKSIEERVYIFQNQGYSKPQTTSYFGRILMLTAGVDEAGRGPLAGPVISAVVILHPKTRIKGLTDSKLLTPEARELLFDTICHKAIAWAIGRAEVHEIDKINILQATLLSMKRAVEKLSVKPDIVLIDGNSYPDLDLPMEAIIGGDLSVPAISAASILAKVTRDREMIELAKKYPNYGFQEHKGYGTPKHLEALKRLGPSPLHRRSFQPVKTLLSLVKEDLPEAMEP